MLLGMPYQLSVVLSDSYIKETPFPGFLQVGDTFFKLSSLSNEGNLLGVKEQYFIICSFCSSQVFM